MNSETMLAPHEVSTYLGGISLGWLAKARMTSEGPQFVKVGRRVFYRKRDLDAWIERNVRHSTSDDGAAANARSRTRHRRDRAPDMAARELANNAGEQ